MPRKGSQRAPQQGSGRNDVDLLNFKLPQRPKQPKGREQAFIPKKKAQKPKRKTGLFPLHCSPDHAFVITRQSYHGGEGQYSFHGSDEVVSWESVRIVKYLTPTILECPICLDSFHCARITKCGHCFCLTCLIHHVQSVSCANSSQAPKCPCCSIPVHLTDTRAVQMVLTNEPVRRFVKLHRAKTCPAPYLPQVGQPRRGANHAAPTVDDADAPYCRFNYVNPAFYQELLQSNLTELGTSHCGTMMEDLCRGQAIQMIQDDLAKAVAESSNEHALAEQFLSPISGVSMMQLSSLAASPQVMGRARGDSVVSCGDISHCSTNSAATNTQAKYGGSMYFDDVEDYMFYQADDGSLNFLSAFNIKCLRAEFSAGAPNAVSAMRNLSIDGSEAETPDEQPIVKAPLPDFVEGRIIETDRVQLTSEVRERLRFLSHLPLYTEIAFVEISMGHLLSNSTKKLFKREFQKRTQKRSAKTNAEKRADAILKQQEEERVNELKARYQSIDPSDEFFRVPLVKEAPVDFSDDHFGPSLGNAASSQSPQRTSVTGFSFSQVIQAGEAFPSLNAANTETNFPSLSAAAIPACQTTQGWKARSSKKPPPSGWGTPKTTDTPVMTPLVPSHKRGSKAKKTVLLSTTHRGGL